MNSPSRSEGLKQTVLQMLSPTFVQSVNLQARVITILIDRYIYKRKRLRDVDI